MVEETDQDLSVAKGLVERLGTLREQERANRHLYLAPWIAHPDHVAGYFRVFDDILRQARVRNLLEPGQAEVLAASRRGLPVHRDNMATLMALVSDLEVALKEFAHRREASARVKVQIAKSPAEEPAGPADKVEKIVYGLKDAVVLSRKERRRLVIVTAAVAVNILYSFLSLWLILGSGTSAVSLALSAFAVVAVGAGVAGLFAFVYDRKVDSALAKILREAVGYPEAPEAFDTTRGG